MYATKMLKTATFIWIKGKELVYQGCSLCKSFELLGPSLKFIISKTYYKDKIY